MFEGRNLLIATKHNKESVVVPLATVLKVNCLVSESFDTDILGTFTGEVERKDDALTTVRKKCLAAMQMYKCDIGIASEGSFGPHPSLPFINADDELLIFIDSKNNLEILSREISTETNFNGEEIYTKEQLLNFAREAGFPSHALILRNAKLSTSEVVKGIADWERLVQVFNELLDKYSAAYVETDMRAMYNPQRMRVIQKAAQKLFEKINTHCPNCETPGFSVTGIKAGLPCKWCNSPTQSTLCYLYTCQKCDFVEEKFYPHKKQYEDPMYCDICNP